MENEALIVEALIIIDYTNDFVAQNGALSVGEKAQNIAGAVCEMIQNAQNQNAIIIVANDIHEKGDETHPEFKLFPPHNIKNTPGRELFSPVKNAIENAKQKTPELVFCVDKTRYSCFSSNEFCEIIKANKIQKLILCGVCTDICVLHTAIDAYNRSINVKIYEKGVASFNQIGHEFALEHFQKCLGFEVEKI